MKMYFQYDHIITTENHYTFWV